VPEIETYLYDRYDKKLKSESDDKRITKQWSDSNDNRIDDSRGEMPPGNPYILNVPWSDSGSKRSLNCDMYPRHPSNNFNYIGYFGNKRMTALKTNHLELDREVKVT